MAISFRGYTIPGDNYDIIRPSPRAQTLRRHHWNLDGETEKRSARTGRMIQVLMLVKDSSRYLSETSITTFLEVTVHGLISTHGTLNIFDNNSNSIKWVFNHCTFDGWEYIPLSGQQHHGAIQDVGGCHGNSSAWIAQVQLDFYQLSQNATRRYLSL